MILCWITHKKIVFYILVENKSSEKIVYIPLKITNAFFSKVHLIKKRPMLIKSYLGKSFRLKWLLIRADVLYRISYIYNISHNQTNHDANYNILDITSVSKKII